MNTVDITGEVYGRLTAIRLIRMNHHNKAVWLFKCDCGNHKEVIASDVKSGRTVSCGCYQKERISKQGKANASALPGYNAMHIRITRARGRAADFKCVDCGQVAAHWSYNKSAPVEYTSLVPNHGKSVIMTYCLDMEHYEPRCAKCHKKYDGLL